MGSIEKGPTRLVGIQCVSMPIGVQTRRRFTVEALIATKQPGKYDAAVALLKGRRAQSRSVRGGGSRSRDAWAAFTNSTPRSRASSAAYGRQAWSEPGEMASPAGREGGHHRRALKVGIVAVVEADLARKEPIFVEFGITGAADGIHLVEALPGEADAVRAVAAVETALDRAEDELAATLPIEGRCRRARPDRGSGNPTVPSRRSATCLAGCASGQTVQRRRYLRHARGHPCALTATSRSSLFSPTYRQRSGSPPRSAAVQACRKISGEFFVFPTIEL